MTASLTLSDGDQSLDLIGTPGTGVWLDKDGFDLPTPAREMTYAESADSEGRRRVRSRTPNPEGKGKVVIGANNADDFWGYVDQFQELIESAHRQKGTLRYVPPQDGEPVTFDLEAIRVSGLPQEGVTLNNFVTRGEFEFECKPYGRRDPEVWFSGVVLDGPIDYIDLEGIPGHVDAWAELTLTEVSSQTREHVEVAVQENYDPNNPESLLIDSDDLVITGFAGAQTTRTGAYDPNASGNNVIRATLTSTPVVICSTGEQPHKGRWKVRLRAYGSTADIRTRLAWKVGDGPISRERWVDIPAAADFYDLDLEVLDIQELETGHSWTGYIEAYATTGVPTLDVDVLFLVPA